MRASWVGKIPQRSDRLPTPVFLPGESPWSEEPGGLQSMRSQKVRHDSSTEHTNLKANIFQIDSCFLTFPSYMGICPTKYVM